MQDREGGRVRSHLAQVLAQSRCVLIGFNGGVCDLATHIPESVQQQIFDYMFERGERFSIVQMLWDLGPMADLAIERGHGDMALDLLSEAEWHASRMTTLVPGIGEVLRACAATGRSVAVVGSNATEVIEDVLARHGLRDAVDIVVGRNGASPPSLVDPVQRLHTPPDRVVLVSDRVQALAWAKEDGLLRVGVEGQDRRKDLSYYGPVVTNMHRLAEAIRAVAASQELT